MKLCSIIFGLLLFNIVQAGEIQVVRIEMQWNALQLTVRPQYNITSSDVIDEAINSGIVLSMIAKLNNNKSKKFWLDETIDKKQNTYQIRYFSLSGQYQLHNINSDERVSFVSLSALWRHLEKNTAFQIPYNTAKVTDYLSVRLSLDTGALPSAMQLPVLLSGDWQFKSDWHETQLEKPSQAQRP